MIFGILGPVDVRLPDGSPVAVGGPGARALLALLLLDAGHIVPIERLIDGLYGEDPPAGAANALQSHVSRLRRGLRSHVGDAESIEFHTTGYRLAVDPEAVDAHRFERLVRAGRQALAAGEHASSAALLGEAVALWRGPALADVPYAGARATRLEELRVTAAEDRIEAEIVLGGLRGAIPELRVLVDAHPLRERPRGLLMRALSGSGRQAEALEVYEDLRRVLAEELGADPSPELAAVQLAVLRGELGGPPAPVLPTPRTPLVEPALPVPEFAAPPGRLTGFVGREHELARLTATAGERLVTLTGPGGTGKTRLAVETAARTVEQVCFVDLTRAADDAALPHVVAAALGIREAGGVSARTAESDPGARIVAVLAEHRLLLILDNCEHVVDGAATLAHRVLDGCPGVRILATSREPLGITGEVLCPVPQLALPAAGADLDTLRAAPAVELFAARAAAVRPGFVVTADNAPDVTRICAALDGLPLAIELAAARLRTLPLAEVAARLDDRFRLLSRGSRTAAPRHRTLHAVVEWSWDLLDPDERALARRLTVFAGGATLAAIATVCGVPADEADDLLAGLAEKSLVTVADGDGGRFRMLETIRAFGVARLAEAGEEERVRRAHAEYFLALADEADAGLRGPDQLALLRRLTAEQGNTDAALRWAIGADPELALRLHAVLTWSWWLGGTRGANSSRSAELFAAVTNGIGTSSDVEAGGELAEEYVLCVVNAAAAPEAGGGLVLDAALDRAAAIMSGIRRPLRHPALMVQWALVGGPDRSDPQAHVAQAADDPWARAVGLLGSGYLALFTGDTEAAAGPLSAAADGFRALGDRWGLANVLEPLAQLADWRGDSAGSAELIDEAIALASELGSIEDLIDFLNCRADLDLRAGRTAPARLGFARAEELARRTGAPVKVRMALRGLGDVARLTGDPTTATALYRQALHGDAEAAMWYLDTRSLAWVGLGRIAAAEGDRATAHEHYGAALDAALTPPASAVGAAAAVLGLAESAAHAGDERRAALLLGAAAVLRGGNRVDTDVFATEAAIRAVAGPEFTTHYLRGAALTRDEAIRAARASE
ncbi:BTAD domain-containing putative transcriptional regulator [Embleya scabrispora]|uniref:BTAD domain-containing putative transcriptional regulator n=1 Tax=Embleya scabrispora TaxID=159449 RepID=UPI000368E036|nr:BTAD domain-containing putative transcriptional regulator [Embleya scabrispora]MYS83349.1 AfsR/SARP family transcriptional regulator [Streptomyces sp. SID5474]